MVKKSVTKVDKLSLSVKPANLFLGEELVSLAHSPRLALLALGPRGPWQPRGPVQPHRALQGGAGGHETRISISTPAWLTGKPAWPLVPGMPGGPTLPGLARRPLLPRAPGGPGGQPHSPGGPPVSGALVGGRKLESFLGGLVTAAGSGPPRPPESPCSELHHQLWGLRHHPLL